MTQHTVPIFNCQRCGSTLTYHEYRAKQWHCAPCTKVLADAKAREDRAAQIDRANGRIR